MTTFPYFTCPVCKMRAKHENLNQPPVPPRLWLFEITGSPPGVKGGGTMSWTEMTSPVLTELLRNDLRRKMTTVLATL